MSEFINTQRNKTDFHWRLLSTVSSLALLVSVYGARDANAEDTDRPVVWIELGADLDRVDSGQQTFMPPFVANNPDSTAFTPVSPAEAQKPPGFSFGADSKILFQPEDSNWVFSASILYGRANDNRNFHQTAKNKPLYKHLVLGTRTVYPPNHNYILPTANFLAVVEKQDESHAVIDFQAGRDFGLGLFGRTGTSVLSVGVRLAQFTSDMQSNLQARPDFEVRAIKFPNQNVPHAYGTIFNHRYHQYEATAQSARSFRGIGPSLSWNASSPFAGNPENSELSVDWGANAAILFGRQKANVRHQTSAQYFGYYKYPGNGAGYQHPQVKLQRARTVTVPNVGGFAGVSISHANAKISIGYRGDFFFGAVDTGFDTAKHSTIGFYGPFASVSIGIGG